MATQIENGSQGRKETKGLRKYLKKFKASVLPIPIGKRKVTDKEKSTSAHRSIKQNETTTIVKDQSTVEVPMANISATVNNNITNDEDKVSAPFLEPMKAFLLLNSHDTIVPLNTDSFTCPKCHTPHSVHYVHEDTEEGQSKELYICLSHGNYGCGWEGNEKPDEDDIHARITENIGFRPLRLN